MVVTFTVIWSPYAWVAIWIIISPHSVPLALTTLPTVFAKTSSAMNPIIYFIMNPNFRGEAIKVLTTKRKMNRVVDAATLAFKQRIR